MAPARRCQERLRDSGRDGRSGPDARGHIRKVVADSSLTSVPGHPRAEVVSPALTYANIPKLQKVIRAVRKLAGARSTHRLYRLCASV